MATNDVATTVEPEIIDEANVLKLKKPLNGGKDELVFDWTRINGYTMLACEKQARKDNPSILVLVLSQSYQAAIAAAAAGVKYDDILGLCGPDFTAACLKAQNFLTESAQ